MSDQGAGGPIESGSRQSLSAHSRSKSENDDAGVEARPAATATNRADVSDEGLPPPSQVSPRRLLRRSDSTTPKARPEPLSRNPSSMSDSTTASRIDPQYVGSSSHSPSSGRGVSSRARPARTRPGSGHTSPTGAPLHSAGSGSSNRHYRAHGHHRLQQSHASASSSRAVSPSRDVKPPVTRSTLTELDVSKILCNPKLRHDINFDPELHFRPNLDGDRGRNKQEKANQFWAELHNQLRLFVTERDAFRARYGDGDDWCLPALLRAVKEIIQTLVPQRDRSYLDEGLNVSLLMQQFNKGIADLEKMASWLAGVLKLHCAPMRDAWVDEMYSQLSNGNQTNDMDELVKGMRNLLSVLEAMKLDVANHQIRCLRPMLIEDTVNFEQGFFLKKINSQKVDLASTKEWYRSIAARFTGQQAQPRRFVHEFGEMNSFFHGLSHIVLPSYDVTQLPYSFTFDEDRLCKLRSDLLDFVNLEICLRLFEEWDALSRNVSIIGLLSPEPTDSASVDSPNYNAAPGSRPSSGVFSTCGSTGSSPRNSGCFGPACQSPPAQPAFVSPDAFSARAPPSVDRSAADLRAKSHGLYDSILALLRTAPAPTPSQPFLRWQAIAQSVAVEVFRNLDGAPASVLPHLESSLIRHLLCGLPVADMTVPPTVAASSGGSKNQAPRPPPLSPTDMFISAEKHIHSRLLPELAIRVKELKNLPGVALFQLATGGRIQGPGRTWDGPVAAAASTAAASAAVAFEAASSRSREQRQRERLIAASGPAAAAGTIRMGLSTAPVVMVMHGDVAVTGIDDITTRVAHLGIVHWRVWADIAYADELDVEIAQAEAEAQVARQAEKQSLPTMSVTQAGVLDDDEPEPMAIDD